MFKKSGRIRSAALALTATGLAFSGIALMSTTSAGATGISLVPEAKCERVVEWTVTNPAEWTLVITGGDLNVPSLAPGATVTVTVDYSDTDDEVAYFDIIGYYENVPVDTFYTPDENGNVPWVEGQSVTLSNEVCTPTTSAPTTTTTAPPVTQPPTSGATTTTEAETTTTTAAPATTSGGSGLAPETVTESQFQVEASVVEAPAAAPADNLAFTGSDNVTLSVIGLMMVAAGVAMLRLRRRTTD